MTSAARAPSVEIFTVALGAYRQPDLHPPLDADGEAEALAGVLLEHVDGHTNPWHVPAGERDTGAVHARLQRWAQPGDRAGSVLAWVGHGTSETGTAHLIVPGARAEPGDDHPAEDALFNPDSLAEQIEREYRRRHHLPGNFVIVLIEACGAGRFVELTAARLLAIGGIHGILLVGVGEPYGHGVLGNARATLAAVLGQYTVNDTAIRLGDLADRLDTAISAGHVQPLRLAGCTLHRPGPTITAPLDVYAALEHALAGLPAAERAHYARKGMGADFGELAWNFVGRRQELGAVNRWLRRQDNDLLVVTGTAGTGKSALLGNLLLHDRPAVHRLLRQAGFLPPHDPSPTGPPSPQIDVCLHLTGMDIPAVVAGIADAAGLPAIPQPPGSGGQATPHVDALATALRDHGQPVTVLADGLDEARDPIDVARLLGTVAALPGVRMIVGTRASTLEGPDQPAPATHDLLDALAAASGQTEVMTLARDPQALAEYLRRQLADLDTATLDHLIDRIASDTTGTREFLFARLAVHELRADPALLSPARRADLDALLDGTHRTLFVAALDRLGRHTPAVPVLLHALAFARGRGLPRADRLWLTVAKSLTGAPVTDADLTEAVRSAAPYIMLDAEHDQSVYRLAHRTFAEHYETLPDHAERGRTVARSLLDSAVSNFEDQTLNPYLVLHLADHIADIGQPGWEHLAANVQTLDRLEPDTVATAVFRHGFGRFRIPAEIQGTVLAAHYLTTVSAADRALPRQLAMAKLGHPLRSEGIAGDGTPTLVAAVQRRETIHRALTGHIGAVTAMVAFAGPDGRALLATGSHDRMVRVWDLETGAQVGDPLAGHTSSVTSLVAFAGPDGRALLATGSHDRTVRVWGLDTGTRVGDLLTRRTGWVVAFTGPDERPLLATGSDDGTVRVWDPITGTAVGTPFTGYTGWVTAVIAFAGPDGRALLATGSHDRTVRIWDLETGAQVGDPLTGHTGWVTAVVTFAGPDGRALLATGSHDRTVRIWDLETGAQVGDPLTGHTGSVTAVVTFAGPDGRALLATGSHDRTVRIWDPDTGTVVGEPFIGHTLVVSALVAFTGRDGRTLLVTGGDDRTVRVWDPDTGTAVGEPSTGHTAGVAAMAAFTGPAGRPLLATGSNDRTVRVWDPDTGTAVGEPLTGHPLAVTALVAFTGPGGRPLLATGGEDRTVRVWDPITGTAVGEPFIGHTAGVAALAAFTGPDGRPLLATGSHDRTVRIWDPGTGAAVGEPLAGHTLAVTALVAFTGPDGRPLLATGSYDRTVRVWDPGTGAAVGEPLTGHTAGVAAMAAFTGPAGRPLIATGSYDRTVRVWDPGIGTAAGEPLTGHTDSVTALVAFTGPEGRPLLVTSGNDETMRIWDPSLGNAPISVRLGEIGVALAVLQADVVVATNQGWARLRQFGSYARRGHFRR
ncbi:hypothetical protein ACFQFC_02675 [Amorphoplanes digitatis]|uniref:WD40 repeat protein n=2 Tax=Actinoplanes digitatis TaxID=1868 RepID=A0A7W7HYH1_9ACTN|nr:hypothetical protein [Actinoplanes digitatis]MBB4763081.1 WD40 repeat protein [Actinoplanes digitatis]